MTGVDDLQNALGRSHRAGVAAVCAPSFAAVQPDVARVTDALALVSGAGGNVLVRADEPTARCSSTAARPSRAPRCSRRSAELPAPAACARCSTRIGTPTKWAANAAFGTAGATIVAHEKTRLHLATDYYLPAEDRYEKARCRAKAQPTESSTRRGETAIGGERIEYGYLLEAHTDGDIYVLFPRLERARRRRRRVAAARSRARLVRRRLARRPRRSLAAAARRRQRANARSCRATGRSSTRAEVQAEHDLMLKLFEHFVDRVRKGDSAEDMLAAGVMDDVGRTFDDPLKFLHDAHRGFWAHHNTLVAGHRLSEVPRYETLDLRRLYFCLPFRSRPSARPAPP